MTEQASHVLRSELTILFLNLPFSWPRSHRDAKGIQQGLKEALKKQDPWDKEIEFQRKKWL